MKSCAGFKFLEFASLPWPFPQPASVLWSEAQEGICATGLPLGRAPLSCALCRSARAGSAQLKHRSILWSLRKPLPGAVPAACAPALSGSFGPLSPRGNKVPPTPNLFCPHSQLWKISEGHRSGSALWCLYWLAPFPFYFFFFILFFFLNNQRSRKCGELTAWQQQRNSLEKLRWILLRFQTFRQESQGSSPLLVVFNHFFCGTLVVHETNLGVQRGGAWAHRLIQRWLGFGVCCGSMSHFFLTSLCEDGTCPFWRRQWMMLCHCVYLKCYSLKICLKIIKKKKHKILLWKILK